MNNEKLSNLNKIVLDYEKSVIDKSQILLDENDLELLFHEDDFNNLMKDDEKINYLFLHKNEIIELLNDLFLENSAIIDLKTIKKSNISENTYNIIYKYLFDNGYSISEDLSLLDTDTVNLFFKDLKNYPRLSDKEQKQLLNNNNEYLKKEDKCINCIVSFYINIIEKCAEKFSNNEIEYNSIKQYLIRYIIQLVNNKKIFFDIDKMDELINNKIQQTIQNRINYYTTNNKLERVFQFDKYILKDKPTKEEVIANYKKYLNYEKERINIKKNIVEHNLRFVVSIAKLYNNKGLSMADLIQEGSIGLMRALDSYDPAIASFTTYATWWVKQSIKRALENTSKTIRLPVHFHEKLVKYKIFYTKYVNEYGQKPSEELLKKELNLSDNDIKEFRYFILNQVSLNDSIGEDEHGVADELGDFIEDPDVNVENEAIKNKIKIDVLEILKSIPEDQMAILLMRFGITLEEPIVIERKNLIILLTSDLKINQKNVNDYLIKNNYIDTVKKILKNDDYKFTIVHLKGYPMTLEEVGRVFNFTRERARQKEAAALKKLQMSKLRKKINYLDY